MIYEYKRYVAHPGKSEALRNRFITHTLPIFNRLGIQVIAVFEPQESSCDLSYIVAFEDQKRRDAAWSSFGADAQWRQVKAHSEQEGPLLATQSTDVMTALVAPAQLID